MSRRCCYAASNRIQADRELGQSYRRSLMMPAPPSPRKRASSNASARPCTTGTGRPKPGAGHGPMSQKGCCHGAASAFCGTHRPSWLKLPRRKNIVGALATCQSLAAAMQLGNVGERGGLGGWWHSIPFSTELGGSSTPLLVITLEGALVLLYQNVAPRPVLSC